MEHAIDRAARIIGSQAALAAALGVTRAAIPQWKDQGRRVPAEHCPVIERLTDGQVTCEQLRPDIEWSVLRTAPAASQPAAPCESEHAQACGDTTLLTVGRDIEHDGDDLAPVNQVTERRHPESARHWIAPKRRETDKPRAG